MVTQIATVHDACRAKYDHSAGDHIFGLLPVMAMRLNGAGGLVDVEDPRSNAMISKDLPVSQALLSLVRTRLTVAC